MPIETGSAWKYRNGPERTGMDTRTDRNGHRNGSEWTVKWTGMDTGTDPNGQWNGPEWTVEWTGRYDEKSCITSFFNSRYVQLMIPSTNILYF